MKPENNPNSNLPEMDNSEQQRKDAVDRFNKLRDSAPAKVPFLKSTAFRVGIPVLFGLAAFEAGGMAYTEMNNQVLVSAHTLQVDAIHPWNIGLESNKPNTESLVLGQNAQYATPAEIQEFIQSPLPVEKPDDEIKTPTDLPQIGILAGIDLQKSGKVECYTSGPVVGAGPLAGQQVPEFLNWTIENENTPLGISIPEGVNTDSVELFLQKPDLVKGQLQYNMFFEKFNLGAGRYRVLSIEIDFLPSDVLKDAPIIDVNRPTEGSNYFLDMANQQGKKVSVADEPTLAYTRNKNSTEYMSILDSGYELVPIPCPQIKNGNTLFSEPR